MEVGGAGRVRLERGVRALMESLVTCPNPNIALSIFVIQPDPTVLNNLVSLIVGYATIINVNKTPFSVFDGHD